MQDSVNDLAFLRASVPELEKYLLSEQLYYPITCAKGRQLTGETTQLTLGNLLLSTARLKVAGLQPEERLEFETLLREVEQIRSRWRSHWIQKVEREIPNRLRLWRNYLSDWTETSHGSAGDYRYNVRLRVILELLFLETDALLVHEKGLLRSLDLRLKGKGTPGAFLWDESFAVGFPREPYWYLYLHF